MLFEAGQQPEFSPTLGADYLLDALKDIGWVSNTGFGAQPILWSEIDAFSRGTAAISEPWEMRALRNMSGAYIDGNKLGEGVFAEFPAHEDG